MIEPTATISELATPTQWIDRLEIFRERFRLGLINESQFKEIARAFQFTDNLGHIWMPGATTNQWYRWDRTKWSAASPPAQLSACEIPIAIAFAWGHPVPPPPPLTKSQIAPGAPPSEFPEPRVETVPEPSPIPEKRARPHEAPPPRIETPPPPPPELIKSKVASSAPPSETPTPRVESPPAPPPVPPKRELPTDLPERGATRSRSKPTDLPK